jgi:hypothetical protein
MPSDSDDTTTPARPIEHVVVLMLENRSFDTMLGWLYPGRPDFDGLTGREANPWHRPTGQVMVPVWTDPGLSRSRAAGPDPDPGELFSDMEEQLFGAGGLGPLVCIRALPDLAQPVLRPYRHRRRLGEQRSAAFPVPDAEPVPPHDRA